jgi:hypothetical protein
MAMKTFGHPQWGSNPRPRIDTSTFALRLAPGEPLAGVTNAIRTKTPLDTIVVARDMPLHLPTLTQRSVFCPAGPEIDDEAIGDAPSPPFGRGHPGLNLEGTYLIYRVRGHDATSGRSRRRWLDTLSTQLDRRVTRGDGVAAERLINMLASGREEPALSLRPIAFIIRLPNRDLEGLGVELFNDGTHAVRLLDTSGGARENP